MKKKKVEEKVKELEIELKEAKEKIRELDVELKETKGKMMEINNNYHNSTYFNIKIKISILRIWNILKKCVLYLI